MIQPSYYNFNFDFLVQQKFALEQEQIFLESFVAQEKSIFKKKIVQYNCQYTENCTIDKDKPGIIVCIKENITLLKFCIDKLKSTNILNICNIIVVDDRPSNNQIAIFCSNNKINYLKVENLYGFNFSMLNNIAAKIFYDRGCSKIILWNSDLWTEDQETITRLLEIHDNMKSDLTGTRLLYPKKSWDGREDIPENISNFFSINNYRETCQFGGSRLLQFNNSIHSIHYGRFKNKKYSHMNMPVDFITGAFMIINLDIFLKIGGLNPSLATQCQDVDLCLKIRENDGIIYYVGEQCLYHDESVSLKDKQKNFQYTSDNVLYTKIWDIERIVKIISGEV